MKSFDVKAWFGSVEQSPHSKSPRRDRRTRAGVELMEAHELMSGYAVASSAYRTFNPQPDPPAVKPDIIKILKK